LVKEDFFSHNGVYLKWPTDSTEMMVVGNQGMYAVNVNTQHVQALPIV